MNIRSFLFEKMNTLLVNLFSALALTVFLKLTGSQNAEVILILITWSIILTVFLCGDYIKMKKKSAEMLTQLEGLDKKYLICEMLPRPVTSEERVYQEMLRAGNKSMLEEVNRAKETLHSYKEYVEEWVHEIKTPITAVDLICKNHVSDVTKRIEKEMQNTTDLVEQILYYARSEVVEKDYFIKEVSISELISSVVVEMRTLFLEKKIQVFVEETDEKILTDEKWVQFILKQILSNAVKYAKEENAVLRIYSEENEKKRSLVIEDNGIGISEEDLPRVCEKGFTGKNRAKQKATGMGLYLVKKLCDRLEITFRIESEETKYTRVSLQFCK